MNEKKIKDAIDAIQPENGAKERMYQNIMKKAEQQAEKAPDRPKKRPVRLIRYALPIAACFCLLVIGLAHFIPSITPTQPDDEFVQIGNPFTEVENADAFKALSITLDAPADAQNTSYAIIDGNMAEVRFELDGKSYLARASAQEGDFSELNGNESSPETIDAKNNAVLTTVRIDTSDYQKITWTNGKINYCLYGTDGADKAQVISAYEALKK